MFVATNSKKPHMTNIQDQFRKKIGIAMSKESMDDLDEAIESLRPVADPMPEKTKYLSHTVVNDKGYAVDSVTRELIEVKEYQVVDLGIKGDFYSHKPLKGEGYVISEGQTAVMLAAGPDKETALVIACKKISGYISQHGEDAFYKLLNIQRDNLKVVNWRYAVLPPVVEEVVTEILPVEVESSLPDKPTDLKSAIDMSLNYRNVIDLDYIAELLNEEVENIREQILDKNLGFENPINGVILAPDEYLSGNVRQKLEEAEGFAIGNPEYQKNVEALKLVIPEDIPASLIQYTIGAAWIPTSIFESFSFNMFKTKIDVSYLASNGKFSAKTKSGIKTIQITSTYAAGTKNGLEIFIATLNNQQIVVTEMVNDGNGNKTVKNLEATSAAQGMQEQMQDEFQAFIMASKEIQDKLEKIYNRVFNGTIERDFRIPELKHYPGSSKHITLRDHQKKGVLRALYESTLFAHQVGSGKSYLIMSTAMEMRRLGIAKKPLIAVQNKTRGQFITAFRELYPEANILAPSPEELTGANRPYLLKQMAEEEWDAIVIPHTQLEAIPDDLDRQRKLIQNQIDSATSVLEGISKKIMPMEHAHANRSLKSLQKEIDQLDIDEEKRKSIQYTSQELFGTVPLLNFEQINVDALLIDEFHRLKRLGFSSSLGNNIKGIDTAKSKRSQSMMLKMRWVQENNNGKNTLGYTGTPISNTMAEAWTMIRYFRPDILLSMGINHFDQFAKTFGQVVPSLEQTGGGTFKIQNRFAKFQNLPEFIAAFRATTDVVLSEDVREFIDNDTIPLLKEGKITQVILPRSQELSDQIAEFRKTLEWYEELEGAEKRLYNYIPLVIFGKAKQAAIDLRLLSPANPDIHNSKVNRVIKNSLKVYFDTGGVQMIFCDLYQSPEPKEEYLDEDCQVPNPAFGLPRFNLFYDIRDKLIANGIRPNEIVVMSEAKWDKPDKLEQMFMDANAGRIKFLLGSTERLGVGINAQQKLIAIHHIDAPARPMDFEQRNGRILRQGNENKEVWIFAYGVEKTLDSAAFQRLSTKQKFINQIMKGVNVERITEDPADEAQMTFDEMMAHLSDSPYAMQKLLVDNRVRAEKVKRDNFYAKQVQIQRQLNNAEEELSRLVREVAKDKEHAQLTLDHFPDGSITHMRIGDEEFTEHFNTAADRYCDMLIERYKESPTLSARGMFLINDVKVNIQVDNKEKISYKTKLMYNAPVMSYTIPEIGLYPDIWDQGIRIESNSGAGLIFSIGFKLNDAIELPKYTLSRIERHELAIAELKNNVDAHYDDSRLTALEEESEALKAKMIEESNKPKEVLVEELIQDELDMYF